MDNSKISSECSSFFALKKSINLINLIADYLSKKRNLDWNEVLNNQKETQNFIDYAVQSNFPKDDLSQYQLKLPLYTQLTNATTYVNDEASQNLFSSSSQFESHPFYSSGSYASQCDKQELFSTPIDNISSTAKPPINNQSIGSSSISTHEGSTDQGYEREYSIKEVPNETINVNLFDSNDETEFTGVPNITDNLSEYRQKYMNLINSEGISSFDQTIPSHILDPKTRYLFNDNFPFSSRIYEVNSNVFGFSSFRGVQLPAINAIMLGMDCFVMMATGVGKSHCYQLPSLLLNGTVVVFSPLLSLIEDQIQSLLSHGIEAQTLNAQTPLSEFKSVSKSLTQYNRSFENGNVLFITPEKFDKSKSVLNLLDNLYGMNRLKLFVIDEAHCVSQWGHSFRKDYRKLCNLKLKFPNVPILAITATATYDVIQDVTTVLRLNNHVLLRTTINRPNLWIEVREKTKTYMDEIIEIIKSTPGFGIIYCLTTSDCERVAEKICKQGIPAAVYHARMEPEDRLTSHKLWKSGQVRIIVATVAFGMGIDKPDVRLILHTSAPTSILSYYQEIGRAGRDGKFSTTILWYSPRDFERHKNINESKSSRNNDFSREMRDFCQDRSTCRRKMILEAFGERPENTSCLGCDNCCLNLPSTVLDVTDAAILALSFVEACMANRNKGILTANMLCDSLRGSNRNRLAKYKLNENPYHGSLKNHTQKFILNVLLQMVKLKILKECRRKSMNFGRTVLISGPRADRLMSGNLRVTITCYEEADKAPKETAPANSQTSPSQAKSSSRTLKRSKTTTSESTLSQPSVSKRKASSRSRSKKSTQSEQPMPNGSQLKDYMDDEEIIPTSKKKSKLFIDLTVDSDRSHEPEFPSIEISTHSMDRETNYDLFGEGSMTQSQAELTKSDLITVEMNNIRRKIPGPLFEPSQPSAWPLKEGTQ